MSEAAPSGFLCVDKAAWTTSRDVTTRIHKHFRPTKVGHVGTLDPLATGLLVLAVGTATRLSNRIHDRPKEYVGCFRLGERSDTEDVTGTVETVDVPTINRAALEAVLDRFRGPIIQTPPAFSAAKVAGKRAYDLARAGRPVRLPPREVEIFDLELVDVPEDEPLREFRLRIVCSSGTYVRSLGRDLAIAAGSSAVMSALRRTRVGPFDLSMAMDESAVTADTPLIDCLAAVDDLEPIRLSYDYAVRVRHGNALPIVMGTDDQVALLTPHGTLLSIATPMVDGLQPSVVMPDAFPADRYPSNPDESAPAGAPVAEPAGRSNDPTSEREAGTQT